MNPIELFKIWFLQQIENTEVKIPGACCLSTVGLDGFPNARFVSLKEITDEGFIITGTLTSRKGSEIRQSNNVALTFWWAETERQVRIQGEAAVISEELADRYFAERSREIQIVSIVSEQGQEINSIETLNKNYRDIEALFSNQPLTRPDNWGGYYISPIRMEFMEFNSSRFHHRILYELNDKKWVFKQLQP
ncbi:MAG: pyridoxamine 5'-phosphate oxidase [Flavobacteriaceae bacterium]